MRALLVASLALASRLAFADDATPSHAATTAAATPEPTHEVAFAVNSPLGWADGVAYAASVYIGVTKQDAIRINGATYRGGYPIANVVGMIIAGGDGDEASRSGRIDDVGVGLVHYSRRLWDGFTVELGALCRTDQTTTSDDMATIQVRKIDTIRVGGHALVGWSWRIKSHAFIAIAAGASAGYEQGTETHSQMGSNPQATTIDVGHGTIAVEGYLRFGGTFGL